MFAHALLLLALLLCAGPAAAETYDDLIDGADLSDPDVHLEIGRWCKKHRMFSTASKHFKRALALDPNHEETRWELGYVMVGERWVHKSLVPGGRVDDGPGNATGEDDGERPPPSGPGPSAAEIRWNTTLWKNPDQEGKITGWIDSQVRLLGAGEAKWDAIATLVQEEYLVTAIQRVAAALADGQRILGGAAMLCADLQRKDKMAGSAKHLKYIRRLLPFLVKASEQEQDPEALYSFASVAAMVGDKRVVPRLIQLMESANDDIQSGARNAIAHLTLMPRDQVTLASAKAWWSRHHALSDADVYATALIGKDPVTRYEACLRLYPFQDKRIVPVLIDLVRTNAEGLAIPAAQLIGRVSGTDWKVNSRTEDEQRKAIAGSMKSWWDEKGAGYTFVEFRNLEPVAARTEVEIERDLAGELISKLASLDMTESNQAYAALQGMGDEVVDALIENLGGARIPAQKCRDLLRTITGQDFGFDAFASDETARQEAIERWRSWRAANRPPEEGEVEVGPGDGAADPGDTAE